jgi:signal transduction histidine kinase
MRRPNAPALRLAGLLLAGALALVARASSAPPMQPHNGWRVVIVMGTDPALPSMRLHDDAFRSALSAGAPGGVTYFIETLDSFRFDYAGLEPEYLALLGKKYAAQPVDLVVGVGDGTVDFVRKHHRELWPAAPVLFSAIDEVGIDRTQVPAGELSVPWHLDIDGTLELIRTLQPDARRLVVVGGTSASDRALVARVVARAGMHGQWQAETWTDESLADMGRRLKALDRGSAVFYTMMSRDIDGRAMFPADGVERLAATSGAPIYGLFSTYIGRGATAGSVIDLSDTGRAAGTLAIAQLTGRSPPQAGLQPPAPARCLADQRQLGAHGLAASALPMRCELRNLPNSLWAEYRSFVLVAGGVVAMQALTIGALLLQRRWRRKAEGELGHRRSELERALRFAAVGELTASIAHEIHQPLGAILSNADAAELLFKRGEVSFEALRDILADIRRDDLRAHEVIRRLRSLLDKGDTEQVETRLHATAQDVLAMLDAEARRRGVVIVTRFTAADDRLLADPVQIQQVLLNLALNAMDAMESPPAGARQIEIGSADRGDAIELTVADRGPGIEADRRESIFESFYTTKATGMGLGLPIVRAIVAAHEGRVRAEAREGGGAVFVVTLPRRLAAARPSVAQVGEVPT